MLDLAHEKIIDVHSFESDFWANKWYKFRIFTKIIPDTTGCPSEWRLIVSTALLFPFALLNNPFTHIQSDIIICVIQVMDSINN